MDNTCPTVRVKADNDDGYAVINESDFDPAKHEMLDGQHEPDPIAESPRRGRPPKAKE